MWFAGEFLIDDGDAMVLTEEQTLEREYEVKASILPGEALARA